MNIDRGLLSVDNLVKHFDISGGMLDQLSFDKGHLIRKRTTVKAVNQVSFTIHTGETLSVVGESGCADSGRHTDLEKSSAFWREKGASDGPKDDRSVPPDNKHDRYWEDIAP